MPEKDHSWTQLGTESVQNEHRLLESIHESWVVPAGVSSALAVLGGEIPTRIDSCTIWGGGSGGVKLWKDQSFCLGGGGRGGGFGVSIPPWSGQSCVRKG